MWPHKGVYYWIGIQYIISVVVLLQFPPPGQSWMTETGLFAGAHITLQLLIQQLPHAVVPMIVWPDLTCCLSRFTDDKPSERCVWIPFWVSYKEDSVRTAVPMIRRPGFSMSCEIIWIALSGNAEVGAHPNETVGCGERSVNKGG